jgi:hypothetical protein
MNQSELKDFLEEKVLQYNTLDFIDSDPVQIPHLKKILKSLVFLAQL